MVNPVSQTIASHYDNFVMRETKCCLSSVFVGFPPVFLVVHLAVPVWLETLLARSRYIPALPFVEQAPHVH